MKSHRGSFWALVARVLGFSGTSPAMSAFCSCSHPSSRHRASGPCITCLLNECMNARPPPPAAHNVTHLSWTNDLTLVFVTSVGHVC